MGVIDSGRCDSARALLLCLRMAEETTTRRGALAVLFAGAAGLAGKLAGAPDAAAMPAIRPPGAVPEAEFLSKCIRCYQCGDVCPNGTLQFRGFERGIVELGTPYVVPRERGCIACMKCTQVCPTGALRPQDPDPDVVPGTTRMGLARLNKGMCYSYAEPARTCGVCYRACPFPGVAMSIGLFERPTVHADKCVGCGLCEQACIHVPQAIRILPVART